jgi:hypothetical protein
MQREAAARLDAYCGTAAPPSKTGTVSTFKPKAAEAVNRNASVVVI